MSDAPVPSPFETYPGSKDAAGACERILASMPPHSVYVEPFLGGGSVVRRKTPALRSIGIELDPEVAAAWSRVAMPGLELVLGCGIAWLESEGPGLPADGLVYCDPPYMHETRSHRRLYRCELSDADHARLLDALEALPCSVLLSGYMSPLYARRLAGWSHQSYRVMTRGGARTEHLWSRSTIAGFVGAAGRAGRDYRERERIKRKAARWVANFAECPRHERDAILAALLDAAGTANAGDEDRTANGGGGAGTIAGPGGARASSVLAVGPADGQHRRICG